MPKGVEHPYGIAEHIILQLANQSPMPKGVEHSPVTVSITRYGARTNHRCRKALSTVRPSDALAAVLEANQSPMPKGVEHGITQGAVGHYLNGSEPITDAERLLSTHECSENRRDVLANQSLMPKGVEHCSAMPEGMSRTHEPITDAEKALSICAGAE